MVPSYMFASSNYDRTTLVALCIPGHGPLQVINGSFGGLKRVSLKPSLFPQAMNIRGLTEYGDLIEVKGKEDR